jgi:small-conductance mechanosensitive channel
MPFLYNLEHILWPFLMLLTSVAIGILLEFYLLYKLRKILAKNNWLSGGKVLQALRGITFIIFLGIGIYICVNNLSLDTKLENYLNKSLYVALILSATILVSRIAVAFLNIEYIGEDGEKNEFQGTSIITNLTRIAVFCLGIVAIMQTLNISVTPVLTALGVGGIAVALAMQDTLSNLFAGIFVIASKKVRIGDYVKLQSGEEGFVEDINWRTTTIGETSSTTVVVPNSKLSNAIFKNYNLPYKELSFPVQLMVSYNNDMFLVEKVALDTAYSVVNRLPNCVKGQTPLVRFQTFIEHGLQFSVILRINEAVDQGPVRHEYIKEVMKAFRENGIEIAERAITLRSKEEKNSLNPDSQD